MLNAELLIFVVEKCWNHDVLVADAARCYTVDEVPIRSKSVVGKPISQQKSFPYPAYTSVLTKRNSKYPQLSSYQSSGIQGETESLTSDGLCYWLGVLSFGSQANAFTHPGRWKSVKVWVRDKCQNICVIFSHVYRNRWMIFRKFGSSFLLCRVTLYLRIC